jgi:hypothetical protein
MVSCYPFKSQTAWDCFIRDLRESEQHKQRRFPHDCEVPERRGRLSEHPLHVNAAHQKMATMQRALRRWALAAR